MGHIRALEESLDAVGIETGWMPKFKELEAKKDAIAKLRSAAREADEVIVATDDDREGEGIGFHVCFVLKLNPATTKRIVFHEITERAITDAIRVPGLLDLNKVAAQQARSMLDLLVGFTISRVLWNRVAPKLSAGRCQTPALRLVVERDALIESHTASASWRLSMTATLPTSTDLPPLSGKAVEELPTEDKALAALEKVRSDTAVVVASVLDTVSTSSAPLPLITSTLQQEASNLHGLSPKTTMMAAQKLYEAGHITYMRTDQAVLSAEAVETIRAWVTEKHGVSYLGTTVGKPKKVKDTKETKTQKPEAQAAHEAIRPTHPEIPDVAVADATQNTVYKLIWRRAVQSQMAAALTDVRKATLFCVADSDRRFVAEQTQSRFLGWRVLERASEPDPGYAQWGPVLIAGLRLVWISLAADEHFTKAKSRFTEASLIKELEEKGIGRPSTFASLVETIVDREYVEKTNVEGTAQNSLHYLMSPGLWPPKKSVESHKIGAEKNKMRSTPLGRSVAEFLTKDYGDLFAYSFTADMEAKLDAVAKGHADWKSVLQTTWDMYKERYTGQDSSVSRQRTLAEGLKVIESKKGPLYVRESAVGKASFAPLGPGQTVATATVEQAEAAFAVQQGELIGVKDGHEIRKKRGPYGLYVTWNDQRLSVKPEMSVEEIIAALTTNVVAFTRVVGEFTIKRGPYGLYFFKHGLKKATFLSFPPTAKAETITATDLGTAYSSGLAAKKKRKPL
jgi:DNA topoisomerase-1